MRTESRIPVEPSEQFLAIVLLMMNADIARMTSGKKLSDLLIESALIVMGILLGLYFQSLADQRETDSRKLEARSRIVTELIHNKEVVSAAVKSHERIIERLTNPDTIRRYLSIRPFDIRRVLGSQPIYEVFPRATSWNAANASGIVSEFAFTDLELLTDTYTFQQSVIDQVSTVAEIILKSAAQNPQETVNGLVMNMQELAGRERLLLLSYEQTLKRMGEDGKVQTPER